MTSKNRVFKESEGMIAFDKPAEEDIEPLFVKEYMHDVGSLFDLPPKVNSLLKGMLRFMRQDNVVVLVRSVKDDINELYGVAITTIDKGLPILLEKGLAIRIRNNEGVIKKSQYLMNPNFFSKLLWKHSYFVRKQFYELTIKYNIKTGEKTVKSKFTGDAPAPKKRGIAYAKSSKVNDISQKIVTTEVEQEALYNLYPVLAKSLKLDISLKEYDYNSYLYVILRQVSLDLASGNKKLKHELTLSVYSSYIQKSLITNLKQMDKDSGATTYKTTYERLTDYTWAKDFNFNN